MQTAGVRSYLVLLRGVNVGGKNIVPMAARKARLEDQGFLTSQPTWQAATSSSSQPSLPDRSKGVPKPL